MKWQVPSFLYAKCSFSLLCSTSQLNLSCHSIIVRPVLIRFVTMQHYMCSMYHTCSLFSCWDQWEFSSSLTDLLMFSTGEGLVIIKVNLFRCRQCVSIRAENMLYQRLLIIAGHIALETNNAHVIQNVHVMYISLTAWWTVVDFSLLKSFHIILIWKWECSNWTWQNKSTLAFYVYMFAYFNEIGLFMNNI